MSQVEYTQYRKVEESINAENTQAHTSELSRIFDDAKSFERTYSAFLEQADKNSLSGKANGRHTPSGLEESKSDGLPLKTHFGQGTASKTPYLNRHVVSIYYVVREGRIVIGIERNRYSRINLMKPLHYEQFDNRKTDVAVFYETIKDAINYSELYEKFIAVSEEVMRLGT